MTSSQQRLVFRQREVKSFAVGKVPNDLAVEAFCQSYCLIGKPHVLQALFVVALERAYIPNHKLLLPRLQMTTLPDPKN